MLLGLIFCKDAIVEKRQFSYLGSINVNDIYTANIGLDDYILNTSIRV